MKITSDDLKSFGICDHIIAEPEGGASKDIALTAGNIAEWLRSALGRLTPENFENLPEKRYQKFRKMGIYRE
jgi:acetyl-CoA carboxylase carboxyl transferase subunit alpha